MYNSIDTLLDQTDLRTLPPTVADIGRKIHLRFYDANYQQLSLGLATGDARRLKDELEILLDCVEG